MARLQLRATELLVTLLAVSAGVTPVQVGTLVSAAAWVVVGGAAVGAEAVPLTVAVTEYV